jgi:hypothetical protein
MILIHRKLDDIFINNEVCMECVKFIYEYVNEKRSSAMTSKCIPSGDISNFRKSKRAEFEKFVKNVGICTGPAGWRNFIQDETIKIASTAPPNFSLYSCLAFCRNHFYLSIQQVCIISFLRGFIFELYYIIIKNDSIVDRKSRPQ